MTKYFVSLTLLLVMVLGSACTNTATLDDSSRSYDRLSNKNLIESFTILGLPANIRASTPADSAAYGGNYNHIITMQLPVSTSMSSLTPTIVISPKARITPASGVPQDFQNPRLYTVNAENGDLNTYLVALTPYKNYYNNILSFSINGQSANIDEYRRVISLIIDSATDVSALTPLVVCDSGALVDPDSTAIIDFTNPVQFAVTSALGVVKIYTASVSTLALSKNSILTFEFIIGGLNVPANIDQQTQQITLQVPPGTDVSNIGTTFTYSQGAVLTTNKGDAITVTNFSTPVIYTVTGTDGIAKEYIVSIQ